MHRPHGDLACIVILGIPYQITPYQIMAHLKLVVVLNRPDDSAGVFSHFT